MLAESLLDHIGHTREFWGRLGLELELGLAKLQRVRCNYHGTASDESFDNTLGRMFLLHERHLRKGLVSKSARF
jgi:hypothetical protein